MAPRVTDELSIPIEATDFPASSGLNGVNQLDVRWGDLIHASITVGKSKSDWFRFGSHSHAEILHRVAMLDAYYDIDKSKRLTTTPAHRHLDPTEKAVTSFYLGMALAKLYADKSLGIPWMMHIGRYGATWAVNYGASTSRPDLFGCNASGEWAVAEAKGRERVTTKLVTKMRKQKSAVASIQGVAPSYSYGSATKFPGAQLALRVVDPPVSHQAQEIPIDAGAWLLDYYGPIVDLLEDGNARFDGDAFIGVLPGAEFEIEVPGTIVEVVRSFRGFDLPRPGPRAAEEALAEEARRPLADQTQDDLRNVVTSIVEAARVFREFGAMGDGLVIGPRFS
ncbi:hypothetical protein OCAE111667_11365 [Occultella aeris]|uniref:Uncharacterized protein n=1 Tax=Occultella aeris TaxID=2761496 RepID=A0A7M4DPM8_9MICO|nr:hypothetical protein [Occultella aeris]VZO39422.1 hypothetical protein HALOF300_04110 [Occultella aeris]